MARIAVVDPLLLMPESTLESERFGPGHKVTAVAGLSEADLLVSLSEAEVILTATVPVTGSMIRAAPRLRLIAKPGAGVDNIDLVQADKHGVVVCNAPGVRGQAVAEHVLFSILYLLRNGWRYPGAGTELAEDLAGRTLGLVGLGDIGRRVAALGMALEMEVVAATPSQRNPDARIPVRFVDVDVIHSVVDVLVLCMPLTSATRGLVRRSTLDEMRADAILVNVARGPCVVVDDLYAVMRSGHLQGAALDVTDPEPLMPDHPLRELPNVLITPHVAGRSQRSQRLAIDVLVDNVMTFLAGGRPPNVVSTGSRR